MSNILMIENGAVMAPDIDGWTVDYMGEQDFADCLSSHKNLKDIDCNTSPTEYNKWNSGYKMFCYKRNNDLIGFVMKNNQIRYITSNLDDVYLADFVVVFLNQLDINTVLYATIYQSYTYNLYLRVGKLLGINYKSRANLNVFIWEIK